jgi:hypothetical protein
VERGPCPFGQRGRPVRMKLPGSSFIHITTVTITGGHEVVKALVQNVTNTNNLRIFDPRLRDAYTWTWASCSTHRASWKSPPSRKPPRSTPRLIRPGVDNGGAPIPPRVQVLRDAGSTISRKPAHGRRPSAREHRFCRTKAKAGGVIGVPTRSPRSPNVSKASRAHHAALTILGQDHLSKRSTPSRFPLERTRSVPRKGGG